MYNPRKSQPKYLVEDILSNNFINTFSHFQTMFIVDSSACAYTYHQRNIGSPTFILETSQKLENRITIVDVGLAFSMRLT